MDRHLDAIDGLRGLAIALVVAYHTWLVYGYAAGALSEGGFLGVEMFFALSGFCMFYPFARARVFGTPAPTWTTYGYRRAIKIVPSYVIALTAFALLYEHRDGLQQTVLAYAAHLLFLHPFFANEFQSISGPLWTIGIEVQFYFLFPLMCGFFLRRPVLAALAVGGVAAGYRMLVTAIDPNPGFFPSDQVIAFLDLFASGMLAAYAVAWIRARPAHPALGAAATTVALVAAAAAAYGIDAFTHSSAMTDQNAFFLWQMHSRTAIAALLFVLVTATTLALPRFRRVVANPVSTFLALISYNLYLWHLEIFALFARLQIPFAWALLAAIGVAAAVTYLIERPLLALRRRQPAVA
jgi:peptidoglycan/LPS O-acetylase OafA/YrhL